MKQHITKKQWDELDNIQKMGFAKVINLKPKSESGDRRIDLCENIEYLRNDFLPNIGQMIEFLGDKWWDYVIFPKDGRSHTTLDCSLRGEKICGNLWEAVKYKLKK